MIVLNKFDKIPLYLQIYEHIKADILSGALTYSTKLDSIRENAITLNVSVKTVQNAYDQLLMEGYIESLERSGYFVAKVEGNIATSFVATPVEINESTYLNTEVTIDSFDYSVWKKTINRVLTNPARLIKTAKKNGETELKKEISNFVRLNRAVTAHHNQIIIGSSTEELLSRLLELIDKPRVAYESPGYEKAERVFKYYATPIPLPVSDAGISIDDLLARNANLAYLSPSHQYPFGTIMPISKRFNMINWAKDTNSYIIEDDYNSVLRYSGSPIPSLQGLDNYGVVVYFGSFSNILFPSINISYMILPRELLTVHEDSKNTYNQTVSVIDQLTLAEFMTEGLFARHIKKIKKMYAKKSELIQKCLLEQGLKTLETSAGTHIVIEMSNELIDDCIQNAKQFNILIEKISDGYILLRFRGMNEDFIEDYLHKIFKRA